MSKILDINQQMLATAGIEDIEYAMLCQEEKIDIPVKHYFLDGMYAREIFMPKDSLLIGHAHSKEFMEVMSQGKVLMFNDEGSFEVTAPFTRRSEPKARKVGYVLEDTIWTTFHATQAKTVEEAEAEIIVKSETFLKYEKEKGKICQS